MLPVLLHMFPVGLLADATRVKPLQTTPDGTSQDVEYTLLIRREHRDWPDYERWYEKRRKRMLEDMRSAGGMPLGRKLPPR